MVSPKVVSIIGIVLKVGSLIGGLATYASNLPVAYQGIAIAVFAAGSSLKDLLLLAGDFFDDGQINKSFKE